MKVLRSTVFGVGIGLVPIDRRRGVIELPGAGRERATYKKTESPHRNDLRTVIRS